MMLTAGTFEMPFFSGKGSFLHSYFAERFKKIFLSDILLDFVKYFCGSVEMIWFFSFKLLA